MTERLGRRARWTAALIVAPGAAALFGASVDWAAATKPAAAAAPAQHALPPAANPLAPALAAAQRLSHTLLAQQRQTAVLSEHLTALNRQIARMIAANNAAAAASDPTRGASSGRCLCRVTGEQPPPPAGNPVQAAPVVIAAPPVAIPAPPVQVVTGASGVPA